MATARDIVSEALWESGVVATGQEATAEDLNKSFTRLNYMMSQWARKRWLVYRLVEAKIVSTGAQSYTIGPSGNITTDVAGAAITVRPDALETAFLRSIVQSAPNQVDYPLSIIKSKEDYSQITLKQLTSFSQYIFYDPTLTNGTIYPWPIATANLYELHMIFKAQLAAFTALDTTVALPPEYNGALLYNLALRLRSAYQVPTPPGDLLMGLAKDSLAVLRGANIAIAKLKMPSEIMRPGLYNILSDQSY